MSVLLYEKSINVLDAGREVTSTRQVVNVISNDTAQLHRFSQFAFDLVLTASLQIVISIYLIHRQNQHGNAVALNGRDCSTQRHFHMIFEEGPHAIAHTYTLREMERAAQRLS